MLGEQHDAAAHQDWQQATVKQLADQQRLAALVIEMAPSTGSTATLARDAGEAEVQQALHWQDAAWPWQRYREVVMSAVRAGVPVLGGNLPRAQMAAAMADTSYDTHLDAAGWQRQMDAIRSGHCDLLPQSQWAPMARIQLARDASMARAAESAIRHGRTVVLVAGRGHVLQDIGIASWLTKGVDFRIAIAHPGPRPRDAGADAHWWESTEALPEQDHCAALRQRFQPKASSTADSARQRP